MRYLLFWLCQLVLTSSQRLDSPDGILVIGGHSESAEQSVEFWSPSNPEEGSCQLNDYPRYMGEGPTANLVSGQLVACNKDSCEIFNGKQVEHKYKGSKWGRLTSTRSRRREQSSAVIGDDRILLIGGHYSNSTEWISVDGSPSQPGPFDVRHGEAHCTIQLSSNLLVITGGDRVAQDGTGLAGIGNLVTSYNMNGNGEETPLTSMNQGRWHHACGVYRDAGGHQVLLVTGGADGRNLLSSTEVAVYSSGSQLEWREVEGGQLPSPRFGLRATLVNAVLYVSAGRDDVSEGGDDDDNDLTSILSWDPATESWQPAGDLAVGRADHAAVAVPASTIALYCKNN